ncbi:MAG: hypothetical protein ABII90_02655 [Bacteroidota bacterium]
MKTLIVNIPEKDESLIVALLKKFRFKTRVLSDEDFEDEDAIAKWISEGMNTEDIPATKLYKYLRKHGVDC